MNTFYVIWSDDIRSLEGKLLTIVESFGLASGQEGAAKSLVRQAIWDEMEKPYRMYLTQPEVDEIAQKQEARKRANLAAMESKKAK